MPSANSQSATSQTPWPPAGVEWYYSDDHVAIAHADCRELLPHVEADVLVTDPPYGYGYASNKAGRFQGRQIANDADTSARDGVIEFASGAPALVFGSWKAPRPSETKNVLIWDKGAWVGMGDLSSPWGTSHEEIYVLGRGFRRSEDIKRCGSVLRFQNVVSWSGESGQRVHPNEKPLGLMLHLLERCPTGVILDPFMGSGTTLRAAKDLGRKAIGIELEERYCEIAAERCSQEVLDLGAEGGSPE